MLKKLIYVLLSLLLSLAGHEVFAELRDPTIPPLVKTDDSPKLNASVFQVSEIILSYDRSIAVINGEYKKIGDEVLGSRIVAIGKNTVQLEGASGKITLFLLGKPVKHVSVKEGM